MEKQDRLVTVQAVVMEEAANQITIEEEAAVKLPATVEVNTIETVKEAAVEEPEEAATPEAAKRLSHKKLRKHLP